MKTSNNDISNALIEKADKWADNKSISEWAELSKKHFGTKGIRDAKLDKKSTIHIYLAEHPTEAPKEQEQDLLCGITIGSWEDSAKQLAKENKELRKEVTKWFDFYESEHKQNAQLLNDNKALREALQKVISINAAPSVDELISKLKLVAYAAIKQTEGK